MSRAMVVWRRACRSGAVALLDLLLPAVCAACGTGAAPLCDPCRQRLHRRPAMACPRCGEAVLGPGAPCRADHAPLRQLAWLAAPWRYAGTGGALVRRFKLDGDPAAGRFLGRGMAGALAPHLAGGWQRAVLVPVPLHRARRRRRGFDQAGWLAARLGAQLGLAQAAVLARVQPTLPQGDPRVGSRAANVAAAFAVRRPERIAGRRVVLVDDVFTSGATARRCAELLRSHGAREVAICCACRS